MLRAAAASLLVSLALVAAASAAPPTLVTAAARDGFATATWTLATGGTAWSIEVAKAADVTKGGDFVADNVVDSDVFPPGTSATTWTGSITLDPGTYYVHVAASDPSCATCDVYEWSNVKSFVVSVASPPAVTPPTSAPAPPPAPDPTPAADPPQPDPSPVATSAPTATTLADVHASRRAHVETVRMTICAPAAGRALVRVRQTLTRAGHVRVTAVSTRAVEVITGCATYRIGWRLAPRFAAAGRYAVAVTLAD